MTPKAEMGRVRNWEEYQHYSGRNNPWLKLYPRILKDHEFLALTDAQRYHVLALFMVALDTGNNFSLDPSYLKVATAATTQINVKRLLDSGFIEFASSSASSPASSKREEKRREEKKRREEIGMWTMKVWEEVATVHGLPSISKMTDPRIATAVARVDEYGKEEVERALRAPAESKFLRGGNDRHWKARYDWILKKSNIPKVLEDQYRDSNLPKRRSVAEIKDEQERRRILNYLGEYRAALLERALELDGEPREMAKRHAAFCAELRGVQGITATEMLERFYRASDAFHRALFDALSIEAQAMIEDETKAAVKKGAKGSTILRVFVREHLELPDPLSFEVWNGETDA